MAKLNSTQKYAQMKLDFAQESVRPWGINLGLRGPVKDTVRVVKNGVVSIKTSAISARRQKQKQAGKHVRDQEYLYPLKDKEGKVILSEDGKPVKILLPYGLMKRVDPEFADELRNRLLNQAEGVFETVRQMDEA